MKKWIKRKIRSITGFEDIKNCVQTNSNDLRLIAGRLAREDSARYVSKALPKAITLTSHHEILDFALQSITPELRDGLILEFGVWQGQSINRIASLTASTVYGFDSFEGLPEDWRIGYKAGEFALEGDHLPDVAKNVKLIKGWFDDTLPVFTKNVTGSIAFIHVDCDLYSSTKTIFKEIGSRLRPNSLILFDEYFGYPSWEEHEYKAFQEFVRDNCRSYEYLAYNPLHEQVLVRITA